MTDESLPEALEIEKVNIVSGLTFTFGVCSILHLKIDDLVLPVKDTRYKIIPNIEPSKNTFSIPTILSLSDFNILV